MSGGIQSFMEPSRRVELCECSLFTATVQRKAWIFRGGVEDAREMNQKDWSKVDIRYRGVFRTLSKVPQFKKGLWDGGDESRQAELDEKKMWAQAQVIYALMSEVGDMLGLQRPTQDGEAVLYLRYDSITLLPLFALLH